MAKKSLTVESYNFIFIFIFVRCDGGKSAKVYISRRTRLRITFSLVQIQRMREGEEEENVIERQEEIKIQAICLFITTIIHNELYTNPLNRNGRFRITLLLSEHWWFFFSDSEYSHSLDECVWCWPFFSLSLFPRLILVWLCSSISNLLALQSTRIFDDMHQASLLVVQTHFACQICHSLLL